MEDETKAVNEAWQKVAPFFLLSEEEREKYISELSERECSELRDSLNTILSAVEEYRRKEATLTKWLKEMLEKEGWQVTRFAPDKQRGPDLEARKGKRTIIMEVKGEAASAGQRVKYVADTLLAILSRMRAQSSDVRYCMVFPDSHLPVVKRYLPDWVREKLGLYILFLNDESLKALYPTLKREKDLTSFDELFEK